MSHQDRTSIVVNHHYLKQVIDWLLAPALFARLRVGSSATWTSRMLAVAALLWAVGEEAKLTDRFITARQIVAKIFRWRPPPGATYQGFIKGLRKWHERLLGVMIPHLRLQMEQVLPQQWKIGGYVVFAGDGSRVELARTQSLEAVFSPGGKKNIPRRKQKKQTRRQKHHRRRKLARAQRRTQRTAAQRPSDASVAKKENSPQMWLTLLWHVGSGLPWAWRTGPSDSSERAHVQEMLPELPKNSLITADAGFVGYDFWSAILAAGHHLVIRVGANVRLLRKLAYARQYEHTVYLWPDAAAKKHRPPLTLRLIVIDAGKHPVYLVTNLPKSQLSDGQAATIYAARWGIELYFRTFKQTFGCRKLRSRCAENAQLEVDWSMLGLWCICLLGQRELAEGGDDPAGLSPAAAIQALQGTMRHYRLRPECTEEGLWTKLRHALLDDYERAGPKTSRDYPRKKKRQSIGAPTSQPASKQQIAAAEQLKQKQQQNRLTA